MSDEDRKDSTRYSKEYYEKNKGVIAERRKLKYWSQPAVREKAKKASRERYRALNEPGKEKMYSVKATTDGNMLLTISHIAEAVGFSVEYLRDLERDGILPKALHHDSRGWRLYTVQQVAAVEYALKMMRTTGWTRERVSEYLSEKWNS